MITLPLLFLSSFLHLASCDQQVLSNTNEDSPDRNGFLRRFNILGDGSDIVRVAKIAEAYDLDLWHATSSYVDIYFPPHALFPEQLEGIPHITPPIAVPTAQSNPSSLSSQKWTINSLNNTTFHETYHPLDEVDSFIDELVGSHPDLTRVTNLGHTAEGREMLGLTISSGAYPEDEKDAKNKAKKKKKGQGAQDGEKMGFVIVGAQHAREWIATATTAYLTQALLANTSEPYSLRPLLSHFDFYVVPMPNPDGYDYTWKSDRLWYKNRQIIGPYTNCIGLDMNRNWGFKWKAKAINRISAKITSILRGNTVTKPSEPTKPCSHWYPGVRPFESPEVNNIANWVAALPNVVAFIDLRSYGQMLSSPYSYTCDRTPKDAEDQVEAALGASHALRSVHGTDFQSGNLCHMLYAAPGNILDWMYAREGIKYSYVAHLRDTGTYGFALPEKLIRPTGEETTALIDYLARFIANQAKRKF